MSDKRPPVRIRFKYNVDTGDIEEFLIDDNAPSASEEYHDKVAERIAGRLGRHLDVVDAGPTRLLQDEPQPAETTPAAKDDDEPETLEQ